MGTIIFDEDVVVRNNGNGNNGNNNDSNNDNRNNNGNNKLMINDSSNISLEPSYWFGDINDKTRENYYGGNAPPKSPQNKHYIGR